MKKHENFETHLSPHYTARGPHNTATAAHTTQQPKPTQHSNTAAALPKRIARPHSSRDASTTTQAHCILYSSDEGRS